MKTSTILFSSICAITFGLQVLNDWGYKTAYEQEINKPRNLLIDLPAGKVRVIVADSIQFEVYADNKKRGVEWRGSSKNITNIVDFMMRGDTLHIKNKVDYDPGFTIYIPAVEVIINKYDEVRYHSPKQQTLTAISQNDGEVALIGGQYDELNVIASGKGKIHIENEETTKIELLNLNLKDESVFESNCAIAQIGKVVASDEASVTLAFKGKEIGSLTKK